MALVSVLVLLEILQRLTITDVLTAKRVDDVHSTCLGSGNCWGFGGMGMVAYMSQACLVQTLFASVTNLKMSEKKKFIQIFIQIFIKF